MMQYLTIYRMENDLTLKKKNKKLLRLEAGMNLQNIMLGEKPD